jgi:hypothetical protein
MREQLRKNGFFLLEQMATSKLLVQVAREHPDRTEAELPQNSEKDIIRGYFQQIVEKVEVTEAELQEFYRENKGMLGGAKLGQVRKQLHQYILHQKREQALSEHIRTLGQTIPIVVSASWVKEQAILAQDNPVDNARMSGRPSLVDFGASGSLSTFEKSRFSPRVTASRGFPSRYSLTGTAKRYFGTRASFHGRRLRGS